MCLLDGRESYSYSLCLNREPGLSSRLYVIIRDEVTVGWRRVCNEEINNFCHQILYLAKCKTTLYIYRWSHCHFLSLQLSRKYIYWTWDLHSSGLLCSI